MASNPVGGRRGLLAGVAALAGAVLAKVSEKPAVASHEGPMYLGFENHAQHPSSLIKDGGAVEYALTIENQVAGASGISATAKSVGLRGLANTDSGTGVVGRGPGIGVWGYSDSPASAPKEAVRGESTYGPGVYGKSTYHAGVYSEGGGTNIALFGITQTGTAVAGQATHPSGYAAQFFGNVNILGSLTVSGSFPKSAGVPHPDGSVRRMYCLEGPESLFEDVGTALLVNGQADVRIDPDFAAVLTADAYSVFLQAEGPSEGLYVERKTPNSFRVREQRNGTSDIPFSYRVVGKRKDLGGKVQRMEKIDVPRGVRRGGDRGLAPDDSALPKPPAAAQPPDTTRTVSPNTR
jgi:hypothetical protein